MQNLLNVFFFPRVTINALQKMNYFHQFQGSTAFIKIGCLYKKN